MLLSSVVILISFTTLSQSRSIGSDQDQADFSWLPQGMSLEEWDHCYGLPCNEQEAIRTKLYDLKLLTMKDEGMDYGPARDIMDMINGNNSAHDISFDDPSLDGCILLNKQQVEYLINITKEHMANKNKTGNSTDEHSRRKRSLTNFQQFPNQKWQKHEFPIRYTFDGKHNEEQRKIIEGAINHWEDQTCIRFEKLEGRPHPSESYIVFSQSNYVCHSYVGKQEKGPQPVYLAETCLWHFGIPVHEIAHVMGVWHTHMRPDRDEYVTIHHDNLGYYKGQFRTVPDAMSHGIPYDHSSVLHYSPMDGSFNGKIVIEAKDPLFQMSMGQRVGLSFYDAMLINKEYCSDVCRGRTWQPCQRGGYQDPNNCHKCKCPDGFGGDFCQDVAPSTPGAECGGVIDMPKYMTRVISTPHYKPDQQSFYYDHTECNWLIRVPQNWHVVLRFNEKFGIYSVNQGECFHWVEVKYKADKQLNGPRFCDSRAPTEPLVSEDQEMVIIFKSNFSTSNHRANIGFQAVISLVPDILLEDHNQGGARYPPPPPPPAPVPQHVIRTPEPRTPEPRTPAPRTPSPTSTTTTTTTTTPRPEPNHNFPVSREHDDNFLWFCNFETDGNRQTWCDIEQEQEQDDFDWQLISGRTDSDMTGPDYAFNGNYYIYIEASKPRRQGDRAVIRMPRFGRSGDHCLSWRYYMYGHHINTLRVVVEGDGRYD